MSDRQAMESRARQGNKLSVDPVALLQREHKMILDKLTMIETTIGARSLRRSAFTKTTRHTLRELLRFFTRRISIHFKRESLLIAALRRSLNRKRGDQNQFQSLLDEHRLLMTDASTVMKRLATKETKTNGAPALLPERNEEFHTLAADVRAFVRRYRGHLSCEERILFVLADMRLTDAQKLRVGHRMLQV